MGGGPMLLALGLGAALLGASPGPPAAKASRSRVAVAFPGAEGGGARSVGGRGGRVITVTNLNDAGTGSLRACTDASGPRTCLFTVGGTITLHRPLEVRSYLTLAGQTAPGGGVQLRGDGRILGGGLITGVDGKTHDVIIRYLRIRPGPPGTSRDPGAPGPRTPAGVSIWGGFNWIIDHVSATWDSNKALSAGYGWNRSTVSWSLFAEGQQGHSTAWLSMNQSHAQADAMIDVDGHHNLFATFDHRLPYFEGKRLRWINNYVFNYGYAALSSAGVELDVIGNVWRRGNLGLSPARREWRWQRLSSGEVSGDSNMGPTGHDPSIHMANNIGPNNPTGALDDFTSMLRRIADGSENGADEGPVDRAYERKAPLPALPVPITARALAVPGDGADLLELLEGEVGASRRVGCDGRWRPARDPVDACILRYVVDPDRAPARPPGGPLASICRAPTDDGWPALAAGAPCPDGDGDGLPDAFEDRVMPGCKHDPGSEDGRCGPAGTSACGHGWTNLECYINGMR